MLDGSARDVDINIGTRAYSIQQSPGLLRSDRKNGTTGAVAWQSAYRCAEWLAESSKLASLLFKPNSIVMELGCGINPLIALTVGDRVPIQYFATDQEYTLKLFSKNLHANTPKSGVRLGADTTTITREKETRQSRGTSTVDVCALDWERDDPVRGQPWSRIQPSNANNIDDPSGIDVLLACDCIYNESLVKAFVDTCIDICTMRRGRTPTRCLVIQQLRSSDVVLDWMLLMLRSFELFRIRDEYLPCRLTPSHGFVVYLATLIEA